MTSNVNISDFSSEKWAQLLHQNYNTNIENFANYVSGKEFGIVHYDAAKNKLICGKHFLNLSEFLKFSLESSQNNQVLGEKRVKVGDGKPIANKKIQHLAKCIQIALKAEKENRIIKPNRSTKSKKTSEISTKALKRSPTITQNERPLKKVKLNPERERIAQILENEFPLIRKLDQKTLNVLNEKLSHASLEGNIEECKKLIKQGAKVNDFSLETTPLSNAIKGNHLDLVEFLLANGANPNLVNSYTHPLLMQAVIHKRYEICRCLIKNGAEINARSKFGDTAFIQAVKSGDNLMVDLLLEHEQLNINARNLQGKTALFYAVRKNELEMCEKLLKLKADPNADSNNKTRFKSSPLEEALKKKKLSIIHLLIDYGANVDNRFDENERSLLMKVICLHPDVFFKVLEKGANIEYVDKGGNTILTILKERRPFYYRPMVDALKNRDPQLSSQAKIFSSRLMLSHAWHLDGKTKISNSKQSYNLDLEGSFSPLWFRQMYKNLPEFCEEYPTAFKQEVLQLEEALQFASGGEYASIDLQLERIQFGFPTFLKTGFKGHAIIFFVWGDRWVTCNLGSKSVSPIHVRHFDPNLLTINVLEDIERATTKPSTYFLRLMKNLKVKLNFQKSLKDHYMSSLSKEYLKMQTVGNCSWTSPMAGIFAFFMLNAIKEVPEIPKPNEPIPDPIKNAIEAYYNWERFQKVFSLQRMLRLIGKTDYNTDYNLIKRVSDLARQDPILDKQLAKLMKKYESEIIDEMESQKDEMQFD